MRTHGDAGRQGSVYTPHLSSQVIYLVSLHRISKKSLSSVIMHEESTNKSFIAEIEALLAQAKSYDVQNPSNLTRLDLLSKVEALHYQLDDPAMAMYRQLTNVRAPSGLLNEIAVSLLPSFKSSRKRPQ